MLILSIDSSGQTAGTALVEEGKVIAEYNVNHGLTHSQTLLPMIDSMLGGMGIKPGDLGAIAVAKGPGSFTGLRIGSATAKGMAMTLEIPIVEISTLAALAYQIAEVPDLICPIMDARRNEVYTCLYEWQEDQLAALGDEEALPLLTVIERLNELGRKVIFNGDGCDVYADLLEKELKVPYVIAPPYQRLQRAAALGCMAVKAFKEGKGIDPDLHVPTYLRVSQAERERANRC